MARHFEDWLKAYVSYTSDLEAPTQFHLWTGVWTIAAALRGKCYFNMRKFRWRPNFFLVLVAPPGIVNKSTTIGVGADLLADLQNIHFGPDSCSWQAIGDAFHNAGESLELDGKPYSMSCLTFSASELGVLIDFNDQAMVNALVDWWDGRARPFKRHTRKDGETLIHNPWINMAAGCTPAWIRQNMPDYAIGGGFASRTVFLYADRKARLVSYPGRESTASSVEDEQRTRQMLIDDLVEISSMAGPFTMEEEAYEAGDAWYTRHWGSGLDPRLADERMGGYKSRKQTHLHKLAMVISASRRDSKIITLNDFETSLALLGMVEDGLKSVFDSIGSRSEVQDLATVLAAIRTYAPVSKVSLFRHLCTRMSFQGFEMALQAAVASGHAESATVPGGGAIISTRTDLAS